MSDKFDQLTPKKEIPRGNGERLLLVDDDMTSLKTVRKLLSQENYDVTAFLRSKNAIDYFEANPEKVDLLITDFKMSGINGTELIRVLLSTRKDLGVIMTTGYDSDEIQWDEENKNIHFLKKPYNLDVMLRLLREILDAQL